MARKNDEPRVTCYWGGLADEFPKGPPTAVVTHRGLKLVVRFDEGDVAGTGPVREIWLQPDTQPLEAGALRLMPSAAMYLRHARAAMAILGSGEGTTSEDRWKHFRVTLEPFRKVAGPGRGLSDGFYRLLAEQHKALIAEGEVYPVKALGEIHGVTISAASRWVTEARRRHYIVEDGDDG
ncbi:MAG: hypothetical protein H0U08_06830 [Actinobacteria bacterium]|nr:hypothetical protein [Actinomycetota bacterium]